MRRAGTTVRLALLVFALQVVAAAALLTALGVWVRWEVSTQAVEAEELLREDLLAVYARDGLPSLARTIAARSRMRATPNAVMLLADADYRAVAGTLREWPRSVSGSGRVVAATLNRHGRRIATRVRATTLPDGAHLLTGVVVEGEARAIDAVEEASLAALALAVLLAVAASVVAARMFDLRLAGPIAALEAAGRGDFAQRAGSADERDAFGRLSRVTNVTLDRLYDLVAELKLATDAMAHDLKSPITRLRAALDRAEAAADRPEDARAMIARAQGEATRLLTIIETALSIARAEGGVGREAFTAVDVAAMLEDLAEIYGPVAEDAGRAIVVAGAAGAATIAVHRELLGQALGNLIDNSLKYGDGIITLAVAREADAVTVTVADQGAGIGAADREAALRKFGRLDAARPAGGAGLGLSLVAAVARLHGGEVVLVDAAPGLRVSLRLAG